MPRKTDKNILKQYFRSGSRPTQNQFHELIDNCFNETFTSFVSGYELLVDAEKNKPNSIHKREGGKTILVPFFERINISHQRVFHYAIPVCNLGGGYILDTITLEFDIPENSDYTVQDKRKKARIKQEVEIEIIKIFNGSDEIFSTSPRKTKNKPVYKLKIGKTSEHWKGIGIDIVIRYDIKSDIAVSDQLDISEVKGEMLEHTFGGAGCVFIQSE